MYKDLTGVCRMCLGCERMAQISFEGVKECNYMPKR